MPSNSKFIAELLNNSATVPDAKITQSSVTQHVTPTDLTPVRQDLAIVAFDSIQSDNRSSLGLSNTFVDQYEDSNSITSLTNTERNSFSEYIASYDFLEKNFNEVQPQMINSKSNSTLTTWDSGNAYSTNWANDSVAYGSGNYTWGTVNYLFDLATNFTINVYGPVQSNGQVTSNGMDYPAYSGFITTDTSVAAGKNPGVFTSAGDAAPYGNVSPDVMAAAMTNSYVTAIGLSNANYGNNTTNGNIGATSLNANDANIAFGNYLNDTSRVSGIKVVNDASTDTLTVHYISNSSNDTVRTDVTRHTITNVPHAGRFFLSYGHASGSISATNMFSLSTQDSADAARSTVFEGIANASGSYQSTAQTASSAVTKMSVVVMYEDNVGTNALNTDIVVQVSADNGSNYTNATLVAAPNLTSTTKVAKSGEVTVTSGTQCRYKVSFANQSSSKIARIKGVALLY